VDSLEGEQQGHHLGDGGDGDPLVGILLVEDPSALLLDEDGSAAVEVELRRGGCSRQQNSFCRFLDVGADGPPSPAALDAAVMGAVRSAGSAVFRKKG